MKNVLGRERERGGGGEGVGEGNKTPIRVSFPGSMLTKHQ